MFVSKGAKESIKNKRKAEFYDNYVVAMINEAKNIGISRQELIRMIEDRK